MDSHYNERFGPLRDRTKQYALRIVRLVRALPKGDDALVIGRQLLRSGTSVAANYRTACRARSRRDFIAKLSVALEEADESALWIELLRDAEIVPAPKLEPLLQETNELVRIFATSLKTTRRREDTTPTA